MGITIFDRVQESTTSAGSGDIALGGAVAGFLSFASTVGVSQSTYYGIVDSIADVWEVGIGTLISSSTLRRDTVLSSSNAGSLVDFDGNPSIVFIDVPAAERLQIDGDGSNLSFTSITVNGESDSGDISYDSDQGSFVFDKGIYTGNQIVFCGAVQSCGNGGDSFLNSITGLGMKDPDSNIYMSGGSIEAAANINAGEGTANTIGTAGQTTFYGDGFVSTGHCAIGNLATINSGSLADGFTAYSPLFIEESVTGTQGEGLDEYSGILCYVNANNTFDGQSYTGIDVEVTTDEASTNAINQAAAIFASFTHQGSGDLDSLYGLYTGVGNLGSGAIEQSFGVYVYTQNPSTGTINNNFGIYIVAPNVPGGGALINVNHGLYIESQLNVANTSYAIETVGGTVKFATGGVSAVGQVIQLAESQEADAFEIFSSDITLLTSIDSSGGIHAPSINASEGSSNTIGTAGLTTFYGDGSNLTSVGASGITLESVIEADATATAIPRFTNGIALNQIYDLTDEGPVAVMPGNGSWSDSGGEIAGNGLQNSHASASGMVGRLDLVSGFNSNGYQQIVVSSRDVTGTIHVDDTLFLTNGITPDATGTQQTVAVSNPPYLNADGEETDTIIPVSIAFPGVTDFMLDQNTDLVDITVYAYPNITVSGDQTSVFTNGDAVVVYNDATGLIFQTTIDAPIFSDSNTTFNIGSDPGFTPTRVVDEVTNVVVHNFTWVTGPTVTFNSVDSRPYYTIGDNVIGFSSGNVVGTAVVRGIYFEEGSTILLLEDPSFGEVEPDYIQNVQRTNMVAIGEVTVTGNNSIAIGTGGFTTTAHNTVQIGIAEDTTAQIDVNGFSCGAGINTNMTASNSIGTVGNTSLFGLQLSTGLILSPGDNPGAVITDTGGWSDSGGNVIISGNSHASASGAAFADGSFAAIGQAGYNFPISSEEPPLAQPFVVFNNVDASSFFNGDDAVVVYDESGNYQILHVQGEISPFYDNINTVILLEELFTSYTGLIFNITTTTALVVDGSTSGTNVVLAGDQTSDFVEGQTLIILGASAGLFSIQSIVSSSYDGTTFTTIVISDDPGFPIGTVFNGTNNFFSNNFSWGINIVIASADVTDFVTDGDSVRFGDSSGVTFGDGEVLAVRSFGEFGTAIFVAGDLMTRVPVGMINSSRTNMVAIGDGAIAYGPSSVAIGAVTSQFPGEVIIGIGDECFLTINEVFGFYAPIINTGEPSPSTIGTFSSTVFFGNTVAVPNINASLESTNTIGTAGHTTFYGDGSNLTGISESGSTPTLQQVTDAGATTTDTIALSIIQVNNSIAANDTSIAATPYPNNCWADGGGTVLPSAQYSHADSGGTVASYGSHAVAGGIAGQYTTVVGYVTGEGGPNTIFFAGDATGSYSSGNTLFTADGSGDAQNITVTGTPIYDGTNTIISVATIPSNTNFLYNENRVNVYSVTDYTFPTVTISGDVTSSFASGDVAFYILGGQRCGTVGITTIPVFASGNTTFEVASDVGSIVQIFDSTIGGRLEQEFVIGYGDSIVVASDLTAFYSVSENAMLVNGGDVSNTTITAVSYNGDADQTTIVISELLNFTPAHIGNTSRTFQAAIGNGSVAIGDQSIAIGSITNLTPSSVQIGYTVDHNVYIDNNGLHCDNINASASGENVIGTAGETIFYGDGSNLTGTQFRQINSSTASESNVYQLASSDVGKMVIINSDVSFAVLVPDATNEETFMPVGAEIDILSTGTGAVLVVADVEGVGVFAFNGMTTLAGQFAAATLKQISSNAWVLIGNLSS